MSTATVAALIEPQILTSGILVYYTSGSGVTTRVDSLSITNPTALAASVTLYLVPAGGSPVAGNAISWARGVNALFETNGTGC